MGLEDDFLKQDADDEKTIEYIKNYLPQELKEKFSDDEFYYFLDLIVDYYATTDVLDATPDKDGYIDLDLERMATTLIEKAAKEKMGTFTTDELIPVIEAEMDFSEQE